MAAPLLFKETTNKIDFSTKKHHKIIIEYTPNSIVQVDSKGWKIKFRSVSSKQHVDFVLPQPAVDNFKLEVKATMLNKYYFDGKT